MKRGRHMLLVWMALSVSAFAGEAFFSKGVDVSPLTLVFTEQRLGSGAFVASDLVVSARHVVERQRNIIIGGSKATVMRFPASGSDVALLRLDRAVPGRACLDPEEPRAGPAVVFYMDMKTTVAQVAHVDLRWSGKHGWYFTGWRPFHGNSGSPVVQDGKIVGVVTRFDLPAGGWMAPVVDVLPRLDLF